MDVPSIRIALATGVVVCLSLLPASAHVNSGVNCANCHGTARQAMALTGFQSAVGPTMVYRASPGQKLPIGINVHNGGSEYGLALTSLEVTGTFSSSHKLTLSPDTAWTKRNGYFSLGPKSGAKVWTLQLNIPSTTPPDTYILTLRAAGTGGGRWHEDESFHVEVSRPVPAAPQLTHPSYDGTKFHCQVATTAGFTYSLETRRDPSQPTWTTVATVPGDGSVKTLTDPNATQAQALYRVRVD